MVAIIDYDAGNVKSVEKAFRKIGQEACLTRDPDTILSADHVVLPGVGNFGDAMNNLKKYGMDEVIREVMESPEVPGLGILKGYVKKFPRKDGMKIPQIGWNSIFMMNGGELFRDIPNGSYVYFVHSFYCEDANINQVRAIAEYSTIYHASVQKGRLFATQFHPEKSGDLGLKILKNFIKPAEDEVPAKGVGMASLGGAS